MGVLLLAVVMFLLYEVSELRAQDNCPECAAIAEESQKVDSAMKTLEEQRKAWVAANPNAAHPGSPDWWAWWKSVDEQFGKPMRDLWTSHWKLFHGYHECMDGCRGEPCRTELNERDRLKKEIASLEMQVQTAERDGSALRHEIRSLYDDFLRLREESEAELFGQRWEVAKEGWDYIWSFPWNPFDFRDLRIAFQDESVVRHYLPGSNDFGLRKDLKKRYGDKTEATLQFLNVVDALAWKRYQWTQIDGSLKSTKAAFQKQKLALMAAEFALKECLTPPSSSSP